MAWGVRVVGVFVYVVGVCVVGPFYRFSYDGGRIFSFSTHFAQAEAVFPGYAIINGTTHRSVIHWDGDVARIRNDLVSSVVLAAYIYTGVALLVRVHDDYWRLDVNGVFEIWSLLRLTCVGAAF